MTYKIYTLGCKVNTYESNVMSNILKNSGYVEDKENVDVAIINTCTVTNTADSKSIKTIRHAIKENPNAIVIVCGCLSQNKIDDIKDINGVNIIIGNIFKTKIMDYILKYKNSKKQIIDIHDISNTEFETMKLNNFNKTRAFVKIQDGCNNFCSYCIIPYTRGNVRSKKREDILNEIKELINNGHKEIVLTGIHTGRYGLEQNTNLETLLRTLVEIPGIFRIRLSSIEINEITDGIIDLIKNNNVMAKHLHIPLQSGSNEILKSMNRLYDLDYFFKRIEYIRKEIENISITTDLIVGFPGETEELFQETLNTLEKIKFTKIHTFPYSKRNGTKAASMKNHIDGNIKKCRVRKVLSISDKYELEFYKKNINKEYDGIVEIRKDNKRIVLTSNYIPVEIDKKLDNNTKVNIKIKEVLNDKIIGEIK